MDQSVNERYIGLKTKSLNTDMKPHDSSCDLFEREIVALKTNLLVFPTLPPQTRIPDWVFFSPPSFFLFFFGSSQLAQIDLHKPSHTSIKHDVILPFC